MKISHFLPSMLQHISFSRHCILTLEECNVSGMETHSRSPFARLEVSPGKSLNVVIAFPTVR